MTASISLSAPPNFRAISLTLPCPEIGGTVTTADRERTLSVVGVVEFPDDLGERIVVPPGRAGDRVWFVDWAHAENAAAWVDAAILLNDVVVIPASFPKTRALLEKRGFRVRTVEVSELQNAEAGVTCTSLVVNDETRGDG